MDLELSKEKKLLRSIAGSWAGRRNFSNFVEEEMGLFLKLQGLGMAVIETDEKGWKWVTLTQAGATRLQFLNRNLPS